MTVDTTELKKLNLIEDVIAELTGYELRGQGAHLKPPKGTKEGGLVVNIDQQIYFWNAHNRGGDVISFLEQEQNMTFRQACEWLARRAGVPLHLDEATAKRMAAARAREELLTTLVGWLAGKLAGSSAATEYCEGRGWSQETMEMARLGFWDGDRKGLGEHCKVHGIDVNDPVVQAMMGLPRDMLIYTHWEGARCVYFSGRSIEGKRHYNPPKDLIGERKPLWNWKFNRQSTHAVIVEGQADAVTLGAWDVPAVALAGVSANPKLVKQLEGFERVYIALDSDATGQNAVTELAAEIGPLCRIVSWPKMPPDEDGNEREIKDANDWARFGGGSQETCSYLLGSAPIYAIWLADRAAAAEPLQREAAIERTVAMVGRMTPYAFERYKKAVANALPPEIGLRELQNMVKAKQKDDTIDVRKEVTLPNGHIDGHLFEVIFDNDHPDGPRTSFAVRYPDGRLGITRVLDTENYRIFPPDPWESILRRGFIKLASDIEEYGSDTELQQEIQTFIHKYVDLPEHIEKLASYYVMMTWSFDSFYVVPYLRARGDSDSGKSRFTETIGHLCLRSVMVTGATTPSPVFRLMEEWNGLTLVMDEADLPHSDTSGDWIMFFNTGYKRNSAILRTRMDQGKAAIEAFDPFGPKIINMRGRFVDDATESRCLTWETSSGRAYRSNIPRYMDRDVFAAEAQRIRNKLLKWRLRTSASIEVDYNDQQTAHLPGRLVEITVSLLSISQNEGFKTEVLKFIERMNEKAVMDRQDTIEAKVLMGILRAKHLPDDKQRDLNEGLWLQVEHITRQTNRIINRENAAASLDEENYTPIKEMSSSYVGKIMKNKLNLETTRATVGNKPKILKWETDRINALIVRYGFEDFVFELAQKAVEREQEVSDGTKGEQDLLL